MTLRDFLDPRLDILLHRVSGPMAFRFILQPTVAAILAIRSGLRDARSGRSPYFFFPALIDPARRGKMFGLLWADVRKVFILAYVLDIVYDLMVNHWLYPVQSLIVAAALAIIPYLLMRGPVAVVVSKLKRP